MGVMTAQDETIRTAIMTVDDDPGVSRAVARDLRRRYGERYRIVRAESASAALDALRQMTERYIECMHTNEPVHTWPVTA